MKLRIASVCMLLAGMGLFVGSALCGRAAAEPAVAEVAIQVSPNTLVLDSEGVWVTVHADIAYSAVMGGTVALNGIPAVLTKPDARGDLVAKFRQSDFKPIVAPPSATLTLTGVTVTGTPFCGSDTITVR
jgi:hypothetical protein